MLCHAVHIIKISLHCLPAAVQSEEEMCLLGMIYWLAKGHLIYIAIQYRGRKQSQGTEATLIENLKSVSIDKLNCPFYT